METYDCKPTLTDTQVLEFCKQGFLMLESVVPHAINQRTSEFIEKHADRKKIFDSILLNKLEGLYSDMEWSLNLNPYKNKFFSFT